MNDQQTTPIEENGPSIPPEKPKKPKNAFLRFLERKDIVFSAKRYGIDALGAMALGLFGSLLIGTIFKAIGLIPGLSFFAAIGGYAQAIAGAAMAIAIAYALKAPPFVLYSAAAVGYAANALGGTEIRVGGGCAALMDGERAVCTFPTAKRPLVSRLPCA